jgi:hypothetical protein
LLTTAAVLPLVAEARSQSAQVSWLRPPDSGVVGELATFVAALAGKTATVLGDPDQPDTYTYIPDIGGGLAVLGEHRMCPGRCGISLTTRTPTPLASWVILSFSWQANRVPSSARSNRCCSASPR